MGWPGRGCWPSLHAFLTRPLTVAVARLRPVLLSFRLAPPHPVLLHATVTFGQKHRRARHAFCPDRRPSSACPLPPLSVFRSVGRRLASVHAFWPVESSANAQLRPPSPRQQTDCWPLTALVPSGHCDLPSLRLATLCQCPFHSNLLNGLGCDSCEQADSPFSSKSLPINPTRLRHLAPSWPCRPFPPSVHHSRRRLDRLVGHEWIQHCTQTILPDSSTCLDLQSTSLIPRTHSPGQISLSDH